MHRLKILGQLRNKKKTTQMQIVSTLFKTSVKRKPYTSNQRHNTQKQR